MERSQNSDANSWSQSYGKTSLGRLCRCNRTLTVVKSWTDDNPGRRFYKCDAHGFFGWVDEEKTYGWQKLSLLEARDRIRQQQEEIRKLRESVASSSQQKQPISSTVDTQMLEKLKAKKNILEARKAKLENEAMTSKERENLLRKFILISWGGVIIVTATIISLLKD